LKIALDEMNAGVREDLRWKRAKQQWFRASVRHAAEQDLLRLQSPEPKPLVFQRTAPPSFPDSRAIKTALGESNVAVSKYLKTVRSSPAGPRIRNTIAETRHGWEAVAWCAAFVNWCLAKAGAPHPDYVTARDWEKFGTRLEAPRKGCIVVFWPLAEPGSSTGHVAFYLHEEGTNVVVVGGNQSDSVKKESYPRGKVRSFRWPPKHVQE
jgi:uncharacterized protein (TIGR02594 family)